MILLKFVKLYIQKVKGEIMLKKIVFSFILIFSFSIDAANNKVGDVDLGEVTHSKAFQFIKDLSLIHI